MIQSPAAKPGVRRKGAENIALTHFQTSAPRWHSLATILLACLTFLAAVSAFAEVRGKKLLSQQFDPRPVSQIEIGDFHFRPGQLAPLHTHAAPSFGYVSKGSIYYQVEGQRPQLLKEGDAFYEPVGPNIVHFDNASKTEEAIFTDFNFERVGEPFIVLPAPLTEKIDRRSFPSETLAGTIANTVEVFEQSLSPSEELESPNGAETVVAYVAEGTVSAQISGQPPIVYLAGQTFYVPKAADGVRVVNASKSGSAKVITFHLSNSARVPN